MLVLSQRAQIKSIKQMKFLSKQTQNRWKFVIATVRGNTVIQKLLSNGNRIRIRISETVLSIFRGFTLLEKVAHCTIIHSLSSEASFQPSVP